ncbi:hypothetical protein HDC93_000591 [Streptomyces sp. AK010]|nr:hypothetical protein [Streptomyces sp. AK010]
MTHLPPKLVIGTRATPTWPWSKQPTSPDYSNTPSPESPST